MEFDKAKVIMQDEANKKILAKLAEPFDVDEIYWKPQAIAKNKTSAMAAAYADPRAYSDRLNDVLGPNKWSCDYVVNTISPIVNTNSDVSKWDRFYYKGKVLVVATLTLEGLGKNSGTGESDCVDDNAITSAEAQAFKRAAVRFGLGRYLYDLPKGMWVPYSETERKITKPPELPDWAIPKRMCDECGSQVIAITHNGRELTVTDLIINSKRKYQKQLCADCQKKRAPVKSQELARQV